MASNVKSLRKAASFTQQQFAEYFEISKRTVENWECGRTTPPDYLVKLFEYKLRNEGIIKGDIEAAKDKTIGENEND